MDLRAPAKFLVGALAVSSLVAWMMPPTHPKMVHQGSWRSAVKPVAAPSLTPEAMSAPWWSASYQPAVSERVPAADQTPSIGPNNPPEPDGAPETDATAEMDNRPAIGNLKVVAVEDIAARLF
jgi:hypothetical protein